MSDAEEIVAETFVVAWRRIHDAPIEPLAWLLVIARNLIANHRRSTIRQGRLVDIAVALERLAGPEPGADHSLVRRSEVLHALAALTEPEREALLLVGWDGLGARDASLVAGCSSRAFVVRLHRARRRLTRALDDAQHPDHAQQPDHATRYTRTRPVPLYEAETTP